MFSISIPFRFHPTRTSYLKTLHHFPRCPVGSEQPDHVESHSRRIQTRFRGTVYPEQRPKRVWYFTRLTIFLKLEKNNNQFVSMTLTFIHCNLVLFSTFMKIACLYKVVTGYGTAIFPLQSTFNRGIILFNWLSTLDIVKQLLQLVAL